MPRSTTPISLDWQSWEQAAAGSSRDSISMMSMQELDPSPIDSPTEEEQQHFPEPTPKPPQRSFTGLGLSGSGHGAVYYLTRIQKYSSYTFLLYSTFHITNTSILPLITKSVSESENYLLLTRPYYQSFPLEPLLITLPILAHITSGLALRIIRRNESLKRYGASQLPSSERMQKQIKVWPTVSYISVSGYLLVPLVFGHAFINRILPWWVDGGSSSVGLGFVAHGFAKHPFLANSGYGALVTIFSGHVVWGMAKWWKRTPVGNTGGEFSSTGKTGRRRWWLLNMTSLVFAGVWMAGALGVVGRSGSGSGWMATLWDDIYSRIPLLNL